MRPSMRIGRRVALGVAIGTAVMGCGSADGVAVASTDPVAVKTVALQASVADWPAGSRVALDPRVVRAGAFDTAGDPAEIERLAHALGARVLRPSDGPGCPTTPLGPSCGVDAFDVVFAMGDLTQDGLNASLTVYSLEANKAAPSKLWVGSSAYELRFQDGAWQVVDEAVTAQ